MGSRRGIILDGDGVLLDSLSHGLAFYPIVAEALNLKVPTIEEMIRFWGWKWKDFIHALWPEMEVEELEQSFDRVYHELGFDKIFLPQVEGANETLIMLKESGHFLALITNRRRHSVIRRFQEAGIELEYFDFIQAVDDYPVCKPNPQVFDPVLQEAQKRRIAKHKTFYVGDTVESDYRAAQGASLEFVGVLTGPTSREEFLAAEVKAENILESIKDLPDFLKKRRA